MQSKGVLHNKHNNIVSCIAILVCFILEYVILVYCRFFYMKIIKIFLLYYESKVSSQSSYKN